MATRKEIGQQIKTCRKSLGFSPLILAQTTQINKTTISEIENGRFTGPFDIFERLIDVVGLQFQMAPKKHSLPDWDEIESLFLEED
ncbi:helix-turn-helix domain-containing protein [Pseudoalteromonas ulvae]|uniref:Transcriptional regulator n=1 Tax=Pseudoalteromonas ulvae TaxID=107327 RepID=A0A244CMP8_PSEDV|nr:transcriptional regulator [Pseudoalteromonas ulvae]OUL56874.1 transcriptional regulator [Pseudoalteromonas ulvae]